MSSRLMLAAAALLLVAGCNTASTHIGDEDLGLGEAVKYNAAVQTINPAPVYAENSAQPGSNGEHAANAIKRYRTDQVKDRHKAEANSGMTGALSTTVGTGSSSNGGSTPH